MRRQHSGLESPALALRLPSYPARFAGKVPKVIRMKQTVSLSEIMAELSRVNDREIVALKDQLYSAFTTESGIVAAIVKNGQELLFLAPEQFEVVEWYA
jgi:hypothetical protein